MKWFVTLSLLTLALAGCTTEDQNATLVADNLGNNDVQEHINETLTNSTNATGPIGVPIVNFTASELVGNGTLSVDFTINVTDDDEVLDWTFMATNESMPITGFDFPATFTVTYEEGIHNATVWVDDGTHNVTTSLQITVGELYVAPPPELVAEYDFSGASQVYNFKGAQYATTCVGYVTGNDGVGCAFSEIDDHEGLRADITTTAGNIRGAFSPACDGSDADNWFEADAKTHSVTVPANAGCIIIWTSTILDIGQARDYNVKIFG